MDSQISGMWSELTRNNEAHAQQLYGLLKKDQGEAEAMRHAYAPAAAKALAKEFQAEYGESVIPVTSVAEAAELEHLGAKAVVVPRSLGTLLRDSGQFPAKDKLLTEFKTGIEKRVQLHELSEMERHILDKGLKLAIAATDASIGEQLMIVEFRDPQLRGLHRNGEIYVRRSELQSLGSFLVVLIHEYAHFKGADGEKGHVDALQNALEKVINMMVETCA
jgi:hypothetical protein